MDAVVTARVPVEIRRQGNEVLRSIGSNPTQLINAAYEYVISHGSLPGSRVVGDLDASDRDLTPEQRNELVSFFNESTFPVPSSYWDGSSDKELIRNGRAADYEALS